MSNQDELKHWKDRQVELTGIIEHHQIELNYVNDTIKQLESEIAEEALEG